MSKADDIKAKAKMVEARYGKTLGASKGTRPAPPAKVTPTLKGGAVGIKVTKKL